MKRKGQSTIGVIVLLAVGLLVAQQAGLFAATADPEGEIDFERGKSATAKVTATDRANASTPNVASTTYGFSNGDISDNGPSVSVTDGAQLIGTASTNSDGTTADLSGFNTGEKAAFITFDSTYPYANPVTIGEVRVENPNVKQDVYQAISSGNIGTTLYDQNGESLSGSVSIGAGETYTFEGFQIRASAENVALNPKLVTVNTTQVEGNLEADGVTMPSAEEVSVPDKLSSDFNYAFYAFDEADLLAGEEPSLSEFQSKVTSAINVNANNDISGDIEFCVEDAGLYQGSNDGVKQGVETDADTDVGAGQSCFTQTIS